MVPTPRLKRQVDGAIMDDVSARPVPYSQVVFPERLVYSGHGGRREREREGGGGGGGGGGGLATNYLQQEPQIPLLQKSGNEIANYTYPLAFAYSCVTVVRDVEHWLQYVS